jgi:hypothetical protein
MHTQMERKEEERGTDGRTERSVIDGYIWMVAFGFLMHSSYWATFIMQIK